MDTLMYQDTDVTMSSESDRPSEDCMMRHTPDCLAKRLTKLEPKLHACFPAEAADYGLDAARDAGLRHIEGAKEGEPCELTYGSAWLLRIAKRAACRYMKRHPRCVSIDMAMFTMRPARAIDAEGEPRDLTGVRDAFEELPDRQKEAVFLRVFVGLSLREAAREMGIAAQTVESYLEKAYGRLKKSLTAFIEEEQ